MMPIVSKERDSSAQAWLDIVLGQVHFGPIWAKKEGVRSHPCQIAEFGLSTDLESAHRVTPKTVVSPNIRAPPPCAGRPTFGKKTGGSYVDGLVSSRLFSFSCCLVLFLDSLSEVRKGNRDGLGFLERALACVDRRRNIDCFCDAALI